VLCGVDVEGSAVGVEEGGIVGVDSGVDFLEEGVEVYSTLLLVCFGSGGDDVCVIEEIVE